MAHKIVNVNRLQGKSKTHNIRFLRESNGIEQFVVTSGSSGNKYRVTHNNNHGSPEWGCTCPWSEYQPQGSSIACSHVQKVVDYTIKNAGYRTMKVRLTTEDTKHLHRKEIKINHNVKVTVRK